MKTVQQGLLNSVVLSTPPNSARVKLIILGLNHLVLLSKAVELHAFQAAVTVMARFSLHASA